MGAAEELAQFDRGVVHFNSGAFFEAHEIWEDLWLRAPAEEKPFLQGMIQIAAAFHHFTRGNLSGTKSLLSAGLAKIAPYPDQHGRIQLELLRVQGRKWVDALKAGKAPMIPKLPQIKRAPLRGIADPA